MDTTSFKAPARMSSSEKEAKQTEEQRQATAAKIQELDDVEKLMRNAAGRRIAYALLREGLRLPDQQISNTNGSLQSYQIGRHDALHHLDDVLRRNFNDLWLLMLEENWTPETTR